MEEGGVQEAVQGTSEANVRDAEERQLLSTVENANADQVPADIPAAAELPAQAPVAASPVAGAVPVEAVPSRSPRSTSRMA